MSVVLLVFLCFWLSLIIDPVLTSNLSSWESLIFFLKISLNLTSLSQAAACDGQTYDITYGSYHNETGGYFPLLQDGNDN